ncbi:MAG TPA: hypothetical protein PK624_01850 [Spirochaetota bacterium]|nr:hypothetical protein [Spirochaetota bacterium]HOU85492.1 hypothetical protein [Spirochaetota bacterium]
MTASKTEIKNLHRAPARDEMSDEHCALAIEAVSFCEAKDTSGERGRCEAVKIISKKNCHNLINN